MAGRDMKLEVIVRLRDELSRGLDGALGKIRSWSMRTTALFSSIGRGIGDLSAKFAAFGVGAGMSLAHGLRSFIDLDKTIRETAVNLGLVSAKAEDWIKTHAKWSEIVGKQIGQASADVATSLHELIGANLPEDAARTMVPQIGRAATASNAAIADLTETSKVLFQSWEIGADQMELGLAKLFEAGRQGNFELKAQARYLPELAPLMRSVGSTGMRAIAVGGGLLQVSKMGAGTEAEAATNFKNFLSKITAPDFKKNMEKAGVDVDAVLKDAAKKNIDPIEAIIGKIVKVTGADKEATKAAADAKRQGLSPGDTTEMIKARVASAIEGSRIGTILPDMQAKTFIATLLQHVAQYKEIRDTISAAGLGGLNDAYDVMMAGPEAKQRMAGERFEQLGRRFGESLTWIFDAGSKVADAFGTIVEKADALSSRIVDLTVNVVAAASAVGTIAGILAFFSRGAPAAAGAAGAAGAAAAATAATTAGAAAGGGSSLFSGLLGLAGRAAPALSFLGRGGPLAALAFVSEALQRGIPTTKEGMAYRLDAGPIDFAAYERAWREQMAWRADPEAARGRAMMRRGGIALPDAPTRHDLADVLPAVTIGKPNISFEAITGSKAPDLARLIGAAFASALKAAGAKEAPKPAPPPPQKVDVAVTVKVDGPGTVTSQTTSGGAGDRGATVGRP